MKTLDQYCDEVAKKYGYERWTLIPKQDLQITSVIGRDILELYAREKVKEAIELARYQMAKSIH